MTPEPKITHFFYDMFDIRDGEAGRVLCMLLYIFLIISSVMIVKPVCNALFLSRYGAEKLPHAFILVALFAALITAVYSRLLARFPLPGLIRSTLVFFALLLTVFWLMHRGDILPGPALFVLYVVIAIFSVLSASQFWSLANMIFNPREAKRLFGFIGSGAIFGGIFGGYLTNLLAPVMGSENIILFSIGFILICLPLVTRLCRSSERPLSFITPVLAFQTGPKAAHPWRLIRKSWHLSYLAAILGIGVLTAKLVEYQFSAIAISHIPQEDELAAFFGFWLSNLNIASLLIQLFVTRRVVGTLGVGTSLFFLPLGILTGALAILFYPVLWAAVYLKVCDGSLKNSINKAGIELMVLPIPSAVKNQIKAFIDVFVDSAATGVGGLLLLGLAFLFPATPGDVSVMIIILVLVWLFLANRIRYEYIQSFRLKISDKASAPEPVDLKNETIFSGLIQALSSENDQTVIATLRMIKDIRNIRLAPSLKTLLSHSNPAIRLEALKQACYYKSVRFMDEARFLTSDPDLDIREEAFHYLFAHSGADRIKMLRSYMKSDDEPLRLAALLCAARESRNNARFRNALKIREDLTVLFLREGRFREEDPEGDVKTVCVRAMGASGIPELIPYIHILLFDRSPAVTRAALAAMGDSGQAASVFLLIYFLGLEGFRNEAFQALTRFGPDIIGHLGSALDDPCLPMTTRLQLPGIIAGFGTQRASDILVRNLDHPDPEFRHEIIRALNRLRNDFPGLQLSDRYIVNRIFNEAKDYVDTLTVLYRQTRNNPPGKDSSSAGALRSALIKKLEDRLDEHVERMFRLLGLKYPPEDIYNVYRGLKSGSPDLRMNAVEFLDNVLETSLKKVIIPIVETPLSVPVLDAYAENLGIRETGEYEGLFLLVTMGDRTLTLMALNLIKALDNIRFITLAGELLAGPDPQIRDKAVEVLKHYGF